MPTLSKALASGPDEETRRRLQQVVSRATNHGYRKLRAVAVLEEIADDAAVRVLKSLSRGQPESRQTIEAMAALRRLRQSVTAAAPRPGLHRTPVGPGEIQGAVAWMMPRDG